MIVRLLAIALCFGVATPGAAAPGVATPGAAAPGEPEDSVWKTSFEHGIAFQLLMDADTLLVGTSRHLYCVDPRSGEQRWRARDLHVKPEDVLSVPGTSAILINQDFGGRFADRETTVIAVDRATGNEMWESKLIKGKGLQAVADPASGALVLVTVKEPHGDDNGLFAGMLPGKGLGSGFERKPRVNAIELATGRVRWSVEFDDEVLMRPSLDAELARGGGKQKDRPFDLSLYHPPLVVGDQVFVTYKGLTCYDLGTGERLWRQEYNTREGELALSYADPIVDGDIVYATGGGRLRAFDRTTGARLWESRDFGVIPELSIDDRAIYGRLGGRFYRVKDEEWEWRGSFGAVAVDRRTGREIWKYDSANDSITNLAIVGDRVWLGDEERLVGLDRETGKRVINERHRLEQRPILSGFNEQGEVLLVSDEEVAGYDAAAGARTWYARHKPIGPSLWKRFAAGLLMTSGAVLTVASFAAANVKGLMPAVPAPAIRVSGFAPIPLFNTRGLMIRAGRQTGRAFWRAGDGMLGVTRFAHLTGTHQYFITKLNGADQALAGVNLTTGQTDKQVPLPSREPNLVVDEINGLVFQARGRQLVALRL
jgi:outer membrane protein assembly factor BamB